MIILLVDHCDLAHPRRPARWPRSGLRSPIPQSPLECVALPFIASLYKIQRDDNWLHKFWKRKSSSRLGVQWLLPSTGDLIFVALLGVLVYTALAVRLLGDAGIGWHIRTGQLILATHSDSACRSILFDHVRPTVVCMGMALRRARRLAGPGSRAQRRSFLHRLNHRPDFFVDISFAAAPRHELSQ